jgi:CheY-like chemotaxis protein
MDTAKRQPAEGSGIGTLPTARPRQNDDSPAECLLQRGWQTFTVDRGEHMPQLYTSEESAENAAVSPASIVLVEDNPHDVELIRLAFAEARLAARIYCVSDAMRLFALMDSLGEPPALVLLDLNLPLIKGDAILKKLRQEGPWKSVPIIVLTSSHLDQDYERCFSYGASAYKVKPSLFEGYLAFADSLRGYLSGRSAVGEDAPSPSWDS